MGAYHKRYYAITANSAVAIDLSLAPASLRLILKPGNQLTYYVLSRILLPLTRAYSRNIYYSGNYHVFIR